MIQLPQISNVSHKFLKVNGSKIHVAEIGQGKPLVLLHGWPQHWYAWHKVIPLLKDQFRLIMPDIRGFGWSDATKDFDYNKEDLAQDIILLLDELKLKHVGLIAHDWGAWIGFLVCLKAPERFTSYLALSSPHPFITINFELWRSYYHIPMSLPTTEFLLQKFPSIVEHILPAVSIDKTIWTKNDLKMYAKILQEPAHAHASVMMYRTFLMKELVPILRGKYKKSRLEVPTRLLVGKNDPIITRPMAEGYQKYVDKMSIEFIKNCGHFMPEEDPDIIAQGAKM